MTPAIVFIIGTLHNSFACIKTKVSQINIDSLSLSGWSHDLFSVCWLLSK